MMLRKVALTLALILPTQLCVAFAPVRTSISNVQKIHSSDVIRSMSDQSEDWNGEVVSNSEDGRIQGCSITQVEGSFTEWIITVDGEEADLGKFSDAIYRKITADAKQQRYQGFRPGTIPPHLLSAYIGFAMDECAREATLEALQQNNIRPFDEVRTEMEIDTISILPPKKKSKKKKKRKKQNNATNDDAAAVVLEGPKWVAYDTMKEAISAGWKPGQSFSFIARNVKGQKLDDEDAPVKAVGAGDSGDSEVDEKALKLNSMQFDGE